MSNQTGSARLAAASPGDRLPERAFCPDNVQSMLYNAALWNGHRIHFDEPYARDVEGYPGLVTAGPLLGDWLHQCVEEWLADEGRIISMEYSNRVACYIGETLHSGGEVLRCDREGGVLELEVFIRNARDEIVAPGIAIVRF